MGTWVHRPPPRPPSPAQDPPEARLAHASSGDLYEEDRFGLSPAKLYPPSSAPFSQPFAAAAAGERCTGHAALWHSAGCAVLQCAHWAAHGASTWEHCSAGRCRV